eukprot:gene9613-11780_t
MISRDPDDMRGYALRGDLSIAKRDYAHALKDYQTILDLNPENLPAYSCVANCQAMLGQNDSAIKNFEKLLYLEPNYIPALGNLGDLYLTLENYDKSLECYEKILAIDPNNLGALIGLANLASAKDNNIDDAIKLMKQVLKLCKNIKDLSTLNYRPQITTDSPQIFDSVERNPAFQAMMGLGFIYNHYKQDYEKSFEYFEMAYHLNPTNESVIGMLASTQKNLGNLEKALEYVQTALKLNPDNTFTKTIEGDILFDLGRYKECKEAYQSVAVHMIEKGGDDAGDSIRLQLFNSIITANLNILVKMNEDESTSVQIVIPPREEVLKKFGEIPANLFELSKKSRELSKYIAELPTHGEREKEFISILVEILRYNVLACNDSISIQHRQTQQQDPDQFDKDKYTSDIDEEFLFGVYQDMVTNLLGDDVKDE